MGILFQNSKWLTPLTRRIFYVALFELLAICLLSVLLSIMSGGGAENSLPIAIGTSVVAVVWNFFYNMGFEKWESTRVSQKRTLTIRILHTLGFEGGLVVLLIPLFMWWYQIGPITALKMELAVLLFFLVFTFVFTWLFDYLIAKR